MNSTQLFEILTVKSFEPIYKNEDEASNIHLVNFEENSFQVVAQKSLYKIGDRVFYIYPDSNLAESPLFASYHAPDGNPNKSKLGKNGRVKAVKFGFTRSNGSKVYSEGILMPIDMIQEALGLFKEQREEGAKTIASADRKGSFPRFMSKSDETNFKACSSRLDFSKPIIGTKKRDGSSITIYYRDEESFGICSRSLEKKLNAKRREYQGYFAKTDSVTGLSYYLSKETMERFEQSQLDEMNILFEEFDIVDEWIVMGTPILEKLKELKMQVAIRGEIFGKNLNAHKANQDAKLPLSFECYGVDIFDEHGEAYPASSDAAIEICKSLEIAYVPVLLEGVFTREELVAKCDKIFEEDCMEGIVIRYANEAGFSAKYMNPVYDEKK